MGVFASITLYARHRHGADRSHDYGKAQADKRRYRWQLGAVASLILAPCIAQATEAVRVAVYHTELSRDGPGLMLRDILSDEDAQVNALAEVIQALDADVLVLLDVDYDHGKIGLSAFADRVGSYPYRFALRPNRGLPTSVDWDMDGQLGGPGDKVGYAEFSGQSGMALLSRYPIDTDAVRDFSDTLWSEVPDTLAEGNEGTVPVSTTGHWHVPVTLPNAVPLNIMLWHATPPVFDGPEDRNGRRNRDEAALWLDKLDGVSNVVLAGGANLDPMDGDGRADALEALLTKLNDVRPRSAGATAASLADGGANATQRGDPALDTADWPDGPNRPGNLRVDYVLPSHDLAIVDAGVLWPLPDTSLGQNVVRASRHRPVWVDILVQGTGNGG